MITVEGKRYKVVENLGYNHTTGKQGKVVIDINGNEHIVTKCQGDAGWRFSKSIIKAVSVSRYTGQF